ncbi:bifunctional adenosylcobinamide kinase/adenosylcobinamide-phosphate guanylyltransferase [Sedimentibacter sp.]|uniref:bifunctional adenosylcobinamide kinase/adenosylcobinamide-phosphate guanylyltransferase n=1 Tax=Sedimentibacter sp. TaxID=1960295 RepID=UPI0028A7299B|nr:bifunctional adenosylcobinamide kinase/adenosylcobinamide-phosphate guanylyltransferase [Sedimentibacter sp.]
MSLTFIIGGARSGKSTYAELKAKEYGEKVAYIATAVITDESMAERVKKHREQRPVSWSTVEMYSDFERLVEYKEFMDNEVVLIDCMTTLIGNYMFDSKINFDTCSPEEVNNLEIKITEEIFSLINVCKANDKKLIMVSNETGLGVVPPYYMGNYFRDISGRINQKITVASDFMYFVLSGIPVKLKHKGEMIKWQEDF